MPMNQILAALLALLTAFSALTMLYIVRERRRRLRADSGAAPSRQEDGAKDKGRPAKPYSHPKINDMMGFEFITVVDVPKELLEEKKDAEPDWSKSSGIGMSVRSSGDTDDQDEIHDDTRPRGATATGGGAQEESRQDSEEEEAPQGEQAEIDPEILEAINHIDCDWNNRDYDSELPDEVLDEVMDNNPDAIETADYTEEDIRASREREMNMRMLEIEQNAIDGEKDIFEPGADIMASLSGDGMPDDEDEDDDPVPADESADGEPDEDDIPDI